MKQRSRGWCLTLNNYTEEEYNNLKNGIHITQLEKYIFGKEIGKNEKTKHIQGFMYFKNGKTLSAVRKISNRAHWEASRGNNEQNYAYCSKDGDFECFGWNKPDNKVKFKGYPTLEEEINNTPFNFEYKQWIEEETKEWFEKKCEYMELHNVPYNDDDNWSTKAVESDSE